jgi:hypothetical protein
MGSRLETTRWGKPALQFLSQCNELDPQRPAVMHVRHTERFNSFKGSDGRMASTPSGREAAAEFGGKLPMNRCYRLFHTYLDRTRETVVETQRGIVKGGGCAELCGEIRPLKTLDLEAFQRWIQSRGWFPEDGGYHATCHWIAGLIPETIRDPSISFARGMAEITMNNLLDAQSNAFHIYVSHDTWVQTLIFHWFGVPPHPAGLRFLDGFLMQSLDGGIRAWFGGRCEVYDYPHWWPKLA